MAELTKRELHRRIASARGQASAMLFFRLPVKGRKPQRDTITGLRYQNQQAIRGLVAILDILFEGDTQSPNGDCGACGKPIRGGKKYVHYYEDGPDFHATSRCWGKRVPTRYVHRAETQREQDRDARKRLKEAKDYLRSQGLIA